MVENKCSVERARLQKHQPCKGMAGGGHQQHDAETKLKLVMPLPPDANRNCGGICCMLVQTPTQKECTIHVYLFITWTEVGRRPPAGF